MRVNGSIFFIKKPFKGVKKELRAGELFEKLSGYDSQSIC